MRGHIEVVENDEKSGRNLRDVVGRMVYDVTGTFGPYEGLPASKAFNSC
jgi:hypothetical protein